VGVALTPLDACVSYDERQGLSARRLGPGWLVAYGRTPADRARLLHRLRAHI
jgi:hypothetical protein